MKKSIKISKSRKNRSKFSNLEKIFFPIQKFFDLEKIFFRPDFFSISKKYFFDPEFFRSRKNIFSTKKNFDIEKKIQIHFRDLRFLKFEILGPHFLKILRFLKFQTKIKKIVHIQISQDFFCDPGW